jgi:hypothetical protein
MAIDGRGRRSIQASSLTQNIYTPNAKFSSSRGQLAWIAARSAAMHSEYVSPTIIAGYELTCP